jgi:hypothetical protein
MVPGYARAGNAAIAFWKDNFIGNFIGNLRAICLAGRAG